jgi:hypothetical protein
VEIARVYANREFFDNFEKIVEDDAKWAYRFQRDFDQKLKDRARVVILPDCDWSDEDRSDEKLSQRRNKSAFKRHRPIRINAKDSRSGVRGSPKTPRKGELRP